MITICLKDILMIFDLIVILLWFSKITEFYFQCTSQFITIVSYHLTKTMKQVLIETYMWVVYDWWYSTPRYFKLCLMWNVIRYWHMNHVLICNLIRYLVDNVMGSVSHTLIIRLSTKWGKNDSLIDKMRLHFYAWETSPIWWNSKEISGRATS